MYKVFIAEQIPARNKGEAAILWGMLAALKALGPIEVSVLSGEPSVDAAEYGTAVTLIESASPEARGVAKGVQYGLNVLQHGVFAILGIILGRRATTLMRGRLWRTYSAADIILIGHDNYLVRRGPYDLFPVAAVAAALRKPLFIYAGTVGPFVDPMAPLLTKFILNTARAITLREEASLKNIRALRVANPAIYLAADPAFLMPPVSQDRAIEILRKEGVPDGRPLIVVTVTQDMAIRFSVDRFGDPNRGYQRYMQLKAKMVDYMIEQFGALVVALAHSTGPTPRQDDRVANAQLRSHVNNAEHFHAIDTNYTAQELKAIVGLSEMVIGERTHSMIAAVSMSIPTVAISSRITGTKTRGIIGEMVGQERFVLNVETTDEETLLRTVQEVWNERDLIRADLQARIPGIKSRALLPGQLVKNILEPNNASRVH
ncbi:MAG: polysaccharide pyruvyl transferase family protein [Candidatus Marsarchaeota archaeon]|nr:polysaccharide pyruvyl transferase family protein [Candidatus Marsarchaeota archaeon]